MTAVDSSVAIAAFASWHEAHDSARLALKQRPLAVAHALIEMYSVLTRLPAPHRAPAVVVVEFARAAFPGAPLVPTPGLQQGLLSRLSSLDIDGGASYDALIALTAAEAGATLLSCDRRAAETYRRCAVKFELLKSS